MKGVLTAKIKELEITKATLVRLEDEYDQLQKRLKFVKNQLIKENKKFASLFGEVVYNNLPMYLGYGLILKKDGIYTFGKIPHGRLVAKENCQQKT